MQTLPGIMWRTRERHLQLTLDGARARDGHVAASRDLRARARDIGEAEVAAVLRSNRYPDQVPLTPFHFGPGLLGKGLAPRASSWSVFIASNVLIDCESLYYLERHEYPVHRQLHTFVGATFAGLVTVGLLLALRAILPKLRAWFDRQPPIMRAEATPLGIAVGAMIDALSHPVLDGLMHPDIEPFQPWSAANPLRGLVALGALHAGCLVAGLVGATLLLARSRR